MNAEDTEWGGIWTVLGCKWTFHILRLLAPRDARFTETRGAIESLPASALSTRLESLQAEGVVEREVNDGSPPTVTYSLTENGDELADVVDGSARSNAGTSDPGAAARGATALGLGRGGRAAAYASPRRSVPTA